MTSAQINYRKLEEEKRHNLEQEQISRDTAALQAETSRYVANTSAAASRYAAEQKAQGSVTAANIASLDRQAQLRFDEETRRLKNSVDKANIELKAIETRGKYDKTQAEINEIQNDVLNDLERLSNQAKELGLKEIATEADAALKKAQTEKASTETVLEIIKTVHQLTDKWLDMPSPNGTK